MHPPAPNAALIALIEAIPAQPIDTANLLTTLQPLMSGTLTFAQTLEPKIQPPSTPTRPLPIARTNLGGFYAND